jgi:CTP synthase
MCQVEHEQVIAVHDVSTTYRVPLLLENQKLLSTISRLLQLDAIERPSELVEQGKLTWKEWVALATSQDHVFETVSIALVGKYTSLHDSYMSVIKSLEHAAMHCKKKLNLIWVDASHLEDAAQESSPAEFHKAWHAVCTADGILVPGGFGIRGTEGMIKATTWARTKRVPFLGVCLGMQLAVIEYARNVCGIEGAGSEELQPNCKNPVIVYMPEVGYPRWWTTGLHVNANDATRWTNRSSAAPCAWASAPVSSRMARRGPDSAPCTGQLQRCGSGIGIGMRLIRP